MVEKTKLSRAWIERKLSVYELENFLFEMFKVSASPSGQQIRDMLKKLFPEKKDYPSIRSINEWKASRWNYYVNLLRKKERNL